MDVEISDPPIYPVQVQGPRAKDVVGSLFGDEVLEMPYYHCAHAALDGIPVVLGRTGPARSATRSTSTRSVATTSGTG